MNLSSHSLFHYTSTFENLKSIINNGFTFSRLTEELPLKGFSTSVFHGLGIISYQFEWYAVCFCDIPLSMIDKHVEQYGAYCIGLTKEWAMKNGVTPIRYVHGDSPDLNDDTFMIALNFDRFVKQYDNNITKTFVQIMKDEGELNNSFDSQEVDRLPNDIKKVLDYLEAHILDLHRYIIEYSGYLRIYSGRWKDRVTQQPTERIFYDEQEWRALTNNPAKDLIFKLDDITHIFVKTREERDEVVQTMKGSSDEKISYKVHLLDEFRREF